jgi:hypothetical protein
VFVLRGSYHGDRISYEDFFEVVAAVFRRFRKAIAFIAGNPTTPTPICRLHNNLSQSGLSDNVRLSRINRRICL